jgi:hypothetical protein
MMTEGHDMIAQLKVIDSSYIGTQAKLGRKPIVGDWGNRLESGEIVVYHSKAEAEKQLAGTIETKGYEGNKEPFLDQVKPEDLILRAPQESGMRFNYDSAFWLTDKKGNKLSEERFTSVEDAETFARNRTVGLGLRDGEFMVETGDLHRIAEELTGSKGERVSLGEHKNARNQSRLVDTQEELTRRGVGDEYYRSNLIFKNPDGTPKTDVSGQMFELPPARTEPYSIAERRNQGEGEGLARSLYGKVVNPIKDRIITSEVDRLAKVAPKAAAAVTDFYRGYRSNLGKFEQSLIRDLKDIRPARTPKELVADNNADFDKVREYRDMLMDGEQPAFELTPVQKKINEALTENLDLTYAERESRPDLPDSPGLQRGTGQTPDYLPHVMSRQVSKILADNPRSAEAERLKEAFIDYRVTKRGQSREDAISDWKDIRKSFTLQEGNDIASQFGAIDKASGLGLPREMRETNLLDRMARFNRRFARRVAYYDSIQSDKEASAELFDSETGISSNVAGKNIVEDIFGVREHNEALRTAVAGVVRSLMLGPLTGAKDVVAGQFLGLQHMDLQQVLPAKIHSFKNWKNSFKSAVDTGVIRENIGAIEMGEAGIDQITQVLTRARDIINKTQGRQVLENTARALAFGEGQYLALDAAKALKTNRLSNQQRKFLEDFMPDWKQLRDGPANPEQINEAAARYVESVQGSYDLRGLPNVAMKGSLALPLSLQRWSIEKFNNFEKFVVQPALDGNFKPMLMATLGLVIGGEAVTNLVELATNKKERTPKLKEIAESKEKVELLTYKLAALATMSGYAGVMGDLAKTSMDAYHKNRIQSWNNPFIDAISTGLEEIGFVVEALQNGDIPNAVDALNMVMSDYVQAYRIASAQLSGDKKEQNERSDKTRDLRVFEMGQNYPVKEADIRRPNPLINKEAREFKKTDDVREAAKMVPELVQQAIEDSKDEEGRINIDMLQTKLSSLKRNSYQTMPSPQRNPVKFTEYKDWLSRTQGPATAQSRIEDYVKQNAKNRAKSSLIPSL